MTRGAGLQGAADALHLVPPDRCEGLRQRLEHVRPLLEPREHPRRGASSGRLGAVRGAGVAQGRQNRKPAARQDALAEREGHLAPHTRAQLNQVRGRRRDAEHDLKPGHGVHVLFYRRPRRCRRRSSSSDILLRVAATAAAAAAASAVAARFEAPVVDEDRLPVAARRGVDGPEAHLLWGQVQQQHRVHGRRRRERRGGRSVRPHEHAPSCRERSVPGARRSGVVGVARGALLRLRLAVVHAAPRVRNLRGRHDGHVCRDQKHRPADVAAGLRR